MGAASDHSPIWPLSFFDVHQDEDHPHFMDLKGQQQYRDSIQCGLGSIITLSSSKVCKETIDILSQLGTAVWMGSPL